MGLYALWNIGYVLYNVVMGRNKLHEKEKAAKEKRKEEEKEEQESDICMSPDSIFSI